MILNRKGTKCHNKFNHKNLKISQSKSQLQKSFIMEKAAKNQNRMIINKAKKHLKKVNKMMFNLASIMTLFKDSVRQTKKKIW